MTSPLFLGGVSTFSDPGSTLRERAESLDQVSLSPSSPSYSILQNEAVAEGNSAFHLAHPGAQDHRITLTPMVVPELDTRLFFESRLGYAGSGQIAKAQVSVAGGSWTTVWSRVGTGNSGQQAFDLVSISLAAYAGQTLQIRFFYDYTGGSYYPQTDSYVGWLIDDIQVGPTYVPRLYEGFGDPSPEEILLVEYINRARADAAAEASRLRNTTDPDVVSATSFFGVDFNLMETQFAALPPSLPPLAINGRLSTAARLHSQDMLASATQSHTSTSSAVSPNQPGDSIGTRAHRQGYQYSNLGESIFAYAESVWHAHAGFNIDWGGGPGGMQDPAGHRLNNHSATFREVGVGVVHGSNGGVGPLEVTEDFGLEQGGDHPFLVGVTLHDGDADGFYDVGEGVGGVSVSVDGHSFAAVSSTHGAYVVPLPDANGTYTVRFQAAGYLPWSTEVTVVNRGNVKVDYAAVPDPGEVHITPIPVTGPMSPFSFELPYAGDADDLSVEVTTNFVSWVPVPAQVQDLGGGRYRIDYPTDGLQAAAYRLIITP